jgi:hypothetical protein
VSLEGSYTSLDRKVHNVETSLRHALSEVRSRVSDVEGTLGQLEDIPRRVDSLEYDLREAKEETERVGGPHMATATSATTATAAMRCARSRAVPRVPRSVPRSGVRRAYQTDQTARSSSTGTAGSVLILVARAASSAIPATAGLSPSTSSRQLPNEDTPTTQEGQEAATSGFCCPTPWTSSRTPSAGRVRSGPGSPSSPCSSSSRRRSSG